MSTLKISKGGLPPVVMVPSSKSYANRALILAALKESPVTLKNLPHATDVSFLVEALKKVGLKISQENSNLVIENSFPLCEREDLLLEVGEGGTTSRFLAGLLLLGEKRYTLKLGKRLKERPWNEFLNSAKGLGAHAEMLDDHLIVTGPANAPAVLEVDCSRTTQFATAFDLTLKKTKVVPINLNSSLSYWNMNAPLKDKISQSDTYVVPLDWSSAAYPMTFAALNHKIEFPGLFVDPFQADSKLFRVLQSLGTVTTDINGMRVSPPLKKMNITLDMSDCLDLFPAMCFLLSHTEGIHTLSGIKNLSHKESDRLAEISKILTTFEREFTINDGMLSITGCDRLCGQKHLELPDDHRIVMTAALFLRHHQGGTLSNSESVDKSYPYFFDLLN